VVNHDDPAIVLEAERAKLGSVRTFGRTAGVDVRLLSSLPEGEGQRLELMVESESLSVFLPLPGAHNALNAAAAIAAATAPLPSASGVAVTLRDVQDGLPRAEGVKGRLKSERIGPYVLIDDCYNANAASMLAALQTVGAEAKRAGARAVALLGEMRELGSFARAEHARVGSAVGSHGFALLGAFGAEAIAIAEQAGEGGVTVRHESTDEVALYDWFKARLLPGDRILVKGSRGIHMERFIERLRREIG
jgi:UDP-N-acetylmuramoyl-tripeptide--D-alanyl-D-alanine ligase